MTKKIYLFIVFPLIGLWQSASGQDYMYNLYPYASLNYNPSHAAIDNDASISLLVHELQIGPGAYFTHNLINAEYPIVTKSGRRYGGLGFTFLEKDAGESDLLKTYTAGMALAYNMQVAPDQFISYGIRGNYFNKRTSLENLATGSQWLASEFRYDPGQVLGESLVANSINYLGLDAGLIWNLVNEQGRKAFLGLSIFHINRPENSFFGGSSKIPMSYLANVGGILYQNHVVQIRPQLFYHADGSINAVNMAVSTKFLIKNKNPYDIIKSGSFEVTGNYGFNRDASLGFLFNQPGLSLGFSYKFPISSNPEFQYMESGIEFGISISKTIWKPKSKKVVISQTAIERERDFYFTQPGASNSQPVTKKSDVEMVRENIEKLTKVKSLQFHLTKNFKFEFGKSTLNQDARLYLDELMTLLNTNSEMSIQVIGHTDNVGKKQVNYQLSQERADAVADYLISKGLDEMRVEPIGMGDTQPVVENSNEANRAKNRRVEFIIFLNR